MSDVFLSRMCSAYKVPAAHPLKINTINSPDPGRGGRGWAGGALSCFNRVMSDLP